MKSKQIDEVAAGLSGVLTLLDRVLIRPLELETRPMISPLPYFAMRILADKEAAGESVTMSELAREMQIAKSQLTVIVDKLIAKKFVVREDDPSDRRTTRIRLSGEGKSFMDQNEKIAVSIIKSTISDLSSDELVELSEAIRLFNKVVDKFHQQQDLT